MRRVQSRINSGENTSSSDPVRDLIAAIQDEHARQMKVADSEAPPTAPVDGVSRIEEQLRRKSSLTMGTTVDMKMVVNLACQGYEELCSCFVHL